eukprot:6695932-Alexandrium_andersonii.AAC.1
MAPPARQRLGCGEGQQPGAPVTGRCSVLRPGARPGRPQMPPDLPAHLRPACWGARSIAQDVGIAPGWPHVGHLGRQFVSGSTRYGSNRKTTS